MQALWNKVSAIFPTGLTRMCGKFFCCNSETVNDDRNCEEVFAHKPEQSLRGFKFASADKPKKGPLLFHSQNSIRRADAKGGLGKGH